MNGQNATRRHSPTGTIYTFTRPPYKSFGREVSQFVSPNKLTVRGSLPLSLSRRGRISRVIDPLGIRESRTLVYGACEREEPEERRPSVSLTLMQCSPTKGGVRSIGSGLAGCRSTGRWETVCQGGTPLAGTFRCAPSVGRYAKQRAVESHRSTLV